MNRTIIRFNFRKKTTCVANNSTKRNTYLPDKYVLTCFLLVLFSFAALAQSNEDCAMCHDDATLTTYRNGKEVSMYIPANVLEHSVHDYLECISCHADAEVEDFPHPENLNPVNCGDCHDEALSAFSESMHGKAFEAGNKNAPGCAECHGKHNITRSANLNAPTHKTNIPFLCGKCHRKDSPVARRYKNTDENIIDNYPENIHGKAFFEGGLMVSATCNDCHGSHTILPASNFQSSVSQKNIKQTCLKCHSKIEDIHAQIINKELWKKSPAAVPACSNCHSPHNIEFNNIHISTADHACLKCHEDQEIHKTIGGEKVSLSVDINDFAESSHKNINCVKCHSDVSPGTNRPCETVKKVNCAGCHAQESEVYFSSEHGKSYFAKNENAPYCTDCHGTHNILHSKNEKAKTYRAAIPALCGECHQKDAVAKMGTHIEKKDSYKDYTRSVHGKGLNEKGLIASAVCSDCHTAHSVLKEEDENSSIHPANLGETCGSCHKGIYDEYIQSEHGIRENTDDLKFPTCATCHTAHTILGVNENEFKSDITAQCGQCHKHLSETYLKTYHGQAHQLGDLDAARCSDCHGAHNIYRRDNPKSTISQGNIVNTCQNCHEGATVKFTKYFTHATHNDKENFPWLYYTFWAMTGLLLSVFLFFGLHTLLWFPRSLAAMLRNKEHQKTQGKQMYVRRFSRKNRITHVFIIVSFIFLALTGMILKFSYMEWAKFLNGLIGGAKVAGGIHRIGAVITFGYFIFHVVSLLKIKFQKKLTFSKFIFGSDSLMFNKKDVSDFWASIKWFVGAGPRPAYGRWTYWEKFDYFAVFWGVLVIGGSGLLLWFPVYFTQLVPGWLINVAHIIHSDEALLAVGFIFTIHFFNTHMRPESFPMDTVIFTGYVPEEEYKKDRPHEYEQLIKKDKLKDVLVEKEFSKEKMRWIKTFGFVALFGGISLIVLIIYSLIFH